MLGYERSLVTPEEEYLLVGSHEFVGGNMDRLDWLSSTGYVLTRPGDSSRHTQDNALDCNQTVDRMIAVGRKVGRNRCQD